MSICHGNFEIDKAASALAAKPSVGATIVGLLFILAMSIPMILWALTLGLSFGIVMAVSLLRYGWSLFIGAIQYAGAIVSPARSMRLHHLPR